MNPLQAHPRRAPASRAYDGQLERAPTPCSCSGARTHALRPITDATERSISPLMMTKVMTTTTIIFSIES